MRFDTYCPHGLTGSKEKDPGPMQPSPIDRPSPDGSPSIAAEDARTEDAVLAFVLAEHPAQFTLRELARELSGGSEDFTALDTIQRAVCELAGSGLLHRHGDFVLPTRAAVRFSRMSPISSHRESPI
jgi:hypothetical protein